MKAAIITVAGISSRFNKDLENKTLKCIYYEQNKTDTLLYRMLEQCREFDKIVIVGGYLFERLERYLQEVRIAFADKIMLVENIHYADFGSCYSLYVGIQALQGMKLTEVVFAEGDLFFDQKSFQELCDADTDVITANREPIYANTAVALYVGEDDRVHYIYDVKHGMLEIKEPFQAILNSGQVWKFASFQKLYRIVEKLSEERRQGTNLEIVREYFSESLFNDIKMIIFQKWINCNTVADYHKMQIAQKEDASNEK